jgi:hypothetical protein
MGATVSVTAPAWAVAVCSGWAHQESGCEKAHQETTFFIEQGRCTITCPWQVCNGLLLAHTYLVHPCILAQLWPRQWGVQCRCSQRKTAFFFVDQWWHSIRIPGRCVTVICLHVHTWCTPVYSPSCGQGNGGPSADARRRPRMFVVVYVVVYDKLLAHTWRHSYCAELWNTYSPLLQLLWQMMLNFVCSWPMQFQQKTLPYLSTLLKIVFLQHMLTTIC